MIVHLISASAVIHGAPAFLGQTAWPRASLAALLVTQRQTAAHYVVVVEELLVVAVIIRTRAAFPIGVAGRLRLSAPLTALAGFIRRLARPVTVMARATRDCWLRRQAGRPSFGPPGGAHVALDQLVRDLQASGAVVAVQHGGCLTVVASLNSVPVGQRLGPDGLACDELALQIGAAPWQAGPAPVRASAPAIPMEALGSRGEDHSHVAVPAGQPEAPLDPAFERIVEQALKHLLDYTWLGQSGLAGELRIAGPSQIEQAKVLHRLLVETIDSLRPSGARPGPTQSVPREWRAYTILHDAYVDDVPNRDIMTRLYISEGTFNRQRRKALRAVAAALLERRGPLVSMAAPDHRRDSRRPLTHAIAPPAGYGSASELLRSPSAELG